MFIGYFPPRYLMSEVIHSGIFPIWNPYIAFGLPFYGDMNGSYWSPITWLISLTIGYNAYTLTLETLFYVFFGGAGMLSLSKHFTANKYLRLIAAVAYMCNGYNIGHLQHLNWLSGAAFLPWCISYFITMYKIPTLKNIFRTVVLLYLLISSSHPGIIIGSFYFFVFLFLFFFFFPAIENQPAYKKAFFKTNVITVVLLLIVSCGLFFGYTDILPHFSRNEKIDLVASNIAPTTWASLLSFLLPFATTKNDVFYQTDIAMRNCYFGIIPFIFFLSSLISKKNKLQFFFSGVGVFFMLLSIKTPLQSFINSFLPLTGYVRLTGEFRIFSILSFLLAAIIQADKFLEKKPNLLSKLKYIILSLLLLLSGLSLFAFSQIFYVKDSFFFHLSAITNQSSLSSFLKNTVDSLSFYDVIFIQSVLMFFFLLTVIFTYRKAKYKTLFFIILCEITIASLLNIPFTGVGKTAVRDLYSIHKRAGEGFPAPILQPIIKNDTLNRKDSSLIGEWSYFNRQIGSTKRVLYPVLLKNTVLYFNQIERDSTFNMKYNPYLFFCAHPENKKITGDSTQFLTSENIISYSVNQIHVRFNSPKKTNLVILQNNYPHWFYKTVNNLSSVNKAGLTFISIPVSKGVNDIECFFYPASFYLYFSITSISFLVLFGLGFLLIKKSKLNAYLLKPLLHEKK